MSSVIEVRSEPMGGSPRSWGLYTRAHMKKDDSHVRNCDLHCDWNSCKGFCRVPCERMPGDNTVHGTFIGKDNFLKAKFCFDFGSVCVCVRV